MNPKISSNSKYDGGRHNDSNDSYRNNDNKYFNIKPNFVDISQLYSKDEEEALTQIYNIIVENCLNENAFFDRVIDNFSAVSTNDQMQSAILNKIFKIESYRDLKKVGGYSIVGIFIGLLNRILLLNKDNYKDGAIELQGMIENAFPDCDDEKINTISAFLLTLLLYKCDSFTKNLTND